MYPGTTRPWPASWRASQCPESVVGRSDRSNLPAAVDEARQEGAEFPTERGPEYVVAAVQLVVPVGYGRGTGIQQEENGYELAPADAIATAAAAAAGDPRPGRGSGQPTARGGSRRSHPPRSPSPCRPSMEHPPPHQPHRRVRHRTRFVSGRSSLHRPIPIVQVMTVAQVPEQGVPWRWRGSGRPGGLGRRSGWRGRRDSAGRRRSAAR